MSNFFKISEAAIIALHSIAYLGSRNQELVNVKEISEKFCFSQAHLSKVLQRLTRMGFVKPIRGPKGGYMLSKNINKINLLEIYECIEGPIKESSCLLNEKACSGGRCILGNTFIEVEESVRKYLQKTKISDLVSVFNENVKKEHI